MMNSRMSINQNSSSHLDSMTSSVVLHETGVNSFFQSRLKSTANFPNGNHLSVTSITM
jgi:hypothetical protein